MATQIKIIATHLRLHLDEIAAIWLLKEFGKEEFFGIENAEIQYWNDSDITKSPEKYETEGILLLGIGGGRFDEHPDNFGNGRKENECCATLIAKHLGLDEDPALKEILGFVKKGDLRMVNDPFSPSMVVKNFHEEHPDNPEKAINWATAMLEVQYRKQERFFTGTKKEFEEKAQVEDIRINGRNLKLVTVVSNDPQINSFARSKNGCQAAVVIQKTSRGNVQIFTNKKYSILFSDVPQMIRLEEQKAKGRLITTDWRELSAEGKVNGAEEWFFHEAGQFLLNGSLTAQNVPPTQMPLEQIKELVKIGVDRNQFYKNCDPGRCRNCYWYSWGLHRCRKLRFEKRNSG